MKPGLPFNDTISLWDATSAEDPAETVALAQGSVDLVIVGGGFTGLSAALHAAEAGLLVQLCEAEHFGYGGSGRNAGLVNAGVWLPPSKARHTLGDHVGGRFLEIFGDGPRRVFDLIERHQIRCEATREGTIHAAHAPAGVDELNERYRDWQALGAPVSMLSRDEVRDRTGSAAFHGGLLDMRAGTINPMGYCRGLSRAARAAGARLATRCRVTALEKAGGGWTVRTDRGDLTARFVVLGTNAYTDRLWPGLSRMYHTIRFFQVATKPLGDRLDGILPGRQGVWTTAPIMTSIRRDAGNRLIVGSMGRVIDGVSQRWAAKELSRLFPGLGPVGFEETWDGAIAMTGDHLPRIVKLDDGVYTPIGYSGRGITTGTIFGAAMARLLTGEDPETLPLPLTDIARGSALAPVHERFYASVFALNQLVRSIL